MEGSTAWRERVVHTFHDNNRGITVGGQRPIAPMLKVGDTYYGSNESGAIFAFTP